VKVALLTGGKDPHYVRGLLRELLARKVHVALIGSDELMDCRDDDTGLLEFHNLIGPRAPDDGLLAKVWRVLRYYGRLVAFAARTDVKLFHILWFRKFPYVERTLLNAYFKLLGKKMVFTAHNVDDQARDGKKRTLGGRLSLTFLYRTVDHVFVHTQAMKCELVDQFEVPRDKVTIVPFGLNDAIPASTTSRSAAKQQLGFLPDQRVVLFFGYIAPYKGVDVLLRALADLVQCDGRLTLLLAGCPKDQSCEPYWGKLEALIDELRLQEYVRKEIRHIPDEDVGLLFRASDVSVLPYRRVYQSGVLALSYAQGLPVIVADVGSLKHDVIEGETGLVFTAGDVRDLAVKIRTYFASDLFRDLATARDRIRQHGAERFSWTNNAELTCAVYARVLKV
jgi:glycosyltransferase involved in cell wall biosynthesis